MGRKQSRWVWGLGGLAALAVLGAGCGGDVLPEAVGSASSALTTDPGSSSVLVSPPSQPTLVVGSDGKTYIVTPRPGEMHPANDSSPDPIPAVPTDPIAQARGVVHDPSTDATAATNMKR